MHTQGGLRAGAAVLLALITTPHPPPPHTHNAGAQKGARQPGLPSVALASCAGVVNPSSPPTRRGLKRLQTMQQELHGRGRSRTVVELSSTTTIALPKQGPRNVTHTSSI
jgi:hypothetical protein